MRNQDAIEELIVACKALLKGLLLSRSLNEIVILMVALEQSLAKIEEDT